MISVCLLTALLAQSPDVQATMLDGQTHAGTLARVDADGATLDLLDGTRLDLPASELQELRLSSDVQPANLNEAELVVAFSDGTQIVAPQFASDGSRVVIESAYGDIEVPVSQVQSVRFSAIAEGQLGSWNDLLSRETQNDLLVILKDGVLDFVGGVVGEIGSEQIAVIVNDRELEIPRSRVFGVIYARRSASRQSPICELTLATGEVLRATDLAWEMDQLIATLSAGADLRIDPIDASILDFGLGKIRYVSDLDSSDLTATYQPVGIQSPDSPLTFPIRVDRRLVLGSDRRSSDRSVWVHSGTTLRLRANRDFRRLEMTTGIVQERFTSNIEPKVTLVITGDGQTLFNETITWDDPARDLQIDIEGVRQIEIQVLQTEATLGSCEHLGLGEARLVK